MIRLAAAALVLLASAPPATSQPLIAAHRGGAGLWPETSRLAFEIPTVLLIGQARMARDRGAAIVQETRKAGASHLGIDHRAIDAATVAAARAAKLALAAWTVNAESDLHGMLHLGADILISDHPALAARLVGR